MTTTTQTQMPLPKLKMDGQALRGACLMELFEILHINYSVKDWGVEVKPHPIMKDWFSVQVWVVMLHKEKTFQPFEITPDTDYDSLRNVLWVEGEIINQWINE